MRPPYNTPTNGASPFMITSLATFLVGRLFFRATDSFFERVLARTGRVIQRHPRWCAGLAELSTLVAMIAAIMFPSAPAESASLLIVAAVVFKATAPTALDKVADTLLSR